MDGPRHTLCPRRWGIHNAPPGATCNRPQKASPLGLCSFIRLRAAQEIPTYSPWGCFRTARAQRTHSANYYGDYPGTCGIMHNQFKSQKFKHLMLAMGPRDLNSAPYSPVHCSSHSMTSFQSSELTELPVVENSQLFAQRAHSACTAHGTPPMTQCSRRGGTGQAASGPRSCAGHQPGPICHPVPRAHATRRNQSEPAASRAPLSRARRLGIMTGRADAGGPSGTWGA